LGDNTPPFVMRILHRWGHCADKRDVRRTVFDQAGLVQLRALVHRSPRTFGQPTSVWTLELAAEVVFAEGITAGRVSDETIRATLARLGLRWRRAKTWITSPDPAYAQKNGAATA